MIGTIDLNQGSTNESWHIKVVLVSKNLLDLRLTHCIVYGCFPAVMAESRSCNRDHVAHKA